MPSGILNSHANLAGCHFSSIAAIQKENVKRLKGLLYNRLENGSLKGLFRKLDVDGSGGLDKREWNRGIQKMGFHLLQGASLRGGTV